MHLKPHRFNWELLKNISGSSCCGAAEMNLTSIHASSIPGLPRWVGDLVLL